MRMKANNEFIDYPGYCDDWDSGLHPTQYDLNCFICQTPFRNGDEFLELSCTHVEHTECIVH